MEWNIQYDYAVEDRDSIDIANAYLLTGQYYLSNLVFDSAYYYYNQAEKLYLIKKDSLNISYTYYIKAYVLNKNGVYSEAEKQILKSIRYNTKEISIRRRHQQYFTIGDVFSGLGMYEDALHYYNQAFELLSDKTILSEESEAYINLSKTYLVDNVAKVYIKQEKYLKAKELLLEGIAKYINFNDVTSERYYAYLAISLASTKLKTNDYKGIHALLNEIIEIGKRNKNRIIIHKAELVLAEYYFVTGQVNLGFPLVERILEEVRSVGDFENQLKALELLISYDSDRSDQFFIEYIEISKRFKGEGNLIQNSFIRIKQEADSLNELNKTLLERNRLLSTITISLFVIVTIILLAYIYHLKIKKIGLIKMFQQDTEQYYNSIINVQKYLAVAKDRERKIIAKELNDGVVNRLFATRFTLMQLKKEEIDNHKDVLVNEVVEVEDYIRNISHSLVNEEGGKVQGFQQLLQELVLVQKRQSNIDFSILIDSKLDLESLDHRKRINIYRSIQEVLLNVALHSNASKCVVDIKLKTPVSFEIAITDNGTGFDTRSIKGGYGLPNVKERIEIIEGKLFVISKKGSGTKILFIIYF
ncbi:tetratricopeptide repeat-containing sensor histidine kinase [Myroides odoratimimus]|uniref:tetratricopeptide repeat-containing sensor histidine kinase n=1 Tax=Myroides odoratimimus TaxID=76832 RepID=UPI001F3BF402|nr:ATP-binding protein [Myroides odoratimimus]